MLTATEAAAALGVSKRHLYIACGAVWFYNEIGWRMRRLMRRSVRPQNTRNAGKTEISTGRHLWHGTAP